MERISFPFLVLVLIVIPIFIEYLLLQALTEWFGNDLYSGTLTGLIMSIIFTLGVYFIAIKPKRLTWKEVGLQRFSNSYWIRIVGWTVFLIVGSILLAIVLESLIGAGTD